MSTPSATRTPDQLLLLATQLLEAALRESRQGGERLGAAIAAIQSQVTDVEQLALNVQESGDEDERIIQHFVLLQGLRDTRREAGNAMVAMQFHDQVVQRVENVRDALVELRNWILAHGATTGPTTGLYAAIADAFTIEEERALFDAMRGDRGRAR